jgi:N-acetylglucosamine kinase-like BadF-type ATPase
MEGLRALARAHDGRDPPTSLTPALLGALDLCSFWDLIPWVAHASKAEIGALAPLVLEAAAAGDPTSVGILDAGLEALGKHLGVVRAAWDPWGGLFPLALSGGLLEEGGLLRPAAMEMAAKRGAELRTGPVVPARGAARLALLLVPPA